MTETKTEAIKIVNQLYSFDILDGEDYVTVAKAIYEIEPLRDRDKELEDLWAQLEDVPMDHETERITERIDEPYLHLPSGTPRSEIWGWFNERYSRGISGLLYGDGVDRTPETTQLCCRRQLCDECPTEFCVFNSDSTCMFPMVSGRKPVVDDEDGCQDIAFEPDVSGCQ